MITDEKNYKKKERIATDCFQPRTETKAGDRGSKERLKNEFAHAVCILK